MTCSRAHHLLQQYVDHRLSLPCTRTLERHLVQRAHVRTFGAGFTYEERYSSPAEFETFLAVLKRGGGTWRHFRSFLLFIDGAILTLPLHCAILCVAPNNITPLGMLPTPMTVSRLAALLTTSEVPPGVSCDGWVDDDGNDHRATLSPRIAIFW